MPSSLEHFSPYRSTAANRSKCWKRKLLLIVSNHFWRDIDLSWIYIIISQYVSSSWDLMNDEKRAANVAHNGFVKFFLFLSLIWSTLLLSSRTLLVLKTFLLLSGFTILISKSLCGLSFIIHYNNVKLNEQWMSISLIGLMERSFFSVRSLSRKRGTSTEVKKLKGSYVKVVVWFRDGIIYYNHNSN